MDDKIPVLNIEAAQNLKEGESINIGYSIPYKLRKGLGDLKVDISLKTGIGPIEVSVSRALADKGEGSPALTVSVGVSKIYEYKVYIFQLELRDLNGKKLGYVNEVQGLKPVVFMRCVNN